MKGRWFTVSLAFLAALPLLYVASYFALAKRGIYYTGGGGGVDFQASYEPLPPEAGGLFSPIHFVDRTWIRHGYWQEKMFPDH
jgi:hypothetical protein